MTEHRFAEAIARIASELIKDRDTNRAVLTVPDSLTPEKQEDLIRACRYQNIDIRLLWRPIAAAIAWIDEYADWLGTEPKNGLSVGTLCVIHLGADVLECTPVDIVWHDEVGRFLPARALPRLSMNSREVMDYGLRITECAAESATGYRLDAAWNLLWTSPLLCMKQSATLEHSPPLHKNDILHQAVAGFRTIHADSGRPATTPTLEENRIRTFGCGSNTPMNAAWSDYIRHLSSLFSGHLIGAVATGVLGSTTTRPGVLDDILDALELSASELTQWQDWPERITAGAAVYSARVAQGEPGYLDTIPIVETLAAKRGEPVWVDLTDQTGLGQDERFVPGGQTWSRTAKDFGLTVPKESDHLTLTLFKEDNDFVRESTTHFEPVRDTAEVDLKVSMDPGQGLPRLEVIPRDRSLFTSRRLVLDWARESDSGKTKQQASDDIPRTNPPLQPRLPSRDCWNGGGYRNYTYESVIGKMKRLTDSLGSNEFTNDDSLRELSDALRGRDHAYRFRPQGPEHATAIGSNGEISGGDEDDRVRQEFVELADSLIGSGQYQNILIRILGYCSAIETEAPNLYVLMRTRISAARKRSSPATVIDHNTLNAIGGCLRLPDDIENFMHVLSKHLDGPGGTNRWLRAMARILQYREDALESCESSHVENLMAQCHEILKDELRVFNAAFIYRHASLCIVYSLRRRRYDSLFLDPQGLLAMSIKRTFEQAIELFRDNRLNTVNGFVSLPNVTSMMIDYIDRKGRGRLESVG